MENLNFYEESRQVPENAKKKIEAGRLKGMTDINPMWRIKKLTELFGPCGIGWKAPIKRTWLDNGAGGEIIANVEVELYIKVDGEWSEPISGIGGAKFVSQEKNGLYTDDECYKKANTDALSVACKALGIGADVYWEADRTKYSKKLEPPAPEPKITLSQIEEFEELGVNVENVLRKFGVSKLEDLTAKQAAFVISTKRAKQ